MRDDLLGVGFARSTVNSHHRVLKTVLAAVGNQAAAKVKALNEKRDARISTALALRWEDLDLETMEFVVTRRLSGYGAGVELVPGVKRDRFGEDVPPLLDEVLVELEALRSAFNEKQRASGLLFPTAQGGFHSRNFLRKPFLDICEHAGITKRFTPHGCRRTGAKLYGRTAGTRMAMDIAGPRDRRDAPALHAARCGREGQGGAPGVRRAEAD